MTVSKTKRPSKKSDIVWESVDWLSFSTELVAGTDEVGRGCLAGPVYAAAVILRPTSSALGLTDSKLIAPEARVEIAERIKSEALSWAVGVASLEEIASLNILQASLLAMRRAIEALSPQPQLVLIDGNQKVGGPWNQQTLTKGDLRCHPISAASIVAKVARDQHMASLDEEYPGYGFAIHKGYGTPVHREAIQKLGPCLVHRRTFAGVREYLGQGDLLSARP